MALPSAALRNDSWPLHGLAKRSQGPDARKGRLLTNLIQVPAALKGHSDSHSSGLLRVSIKELLVGNLRPKERSKGSLSGSARPSLPALCVCEGWELVVILQTQARHGFCFVDTSSQRGPSIHANFQRRQGRQWCLPRSGGHPQVPRN